jgi:hypothetical protein
MSFRKRNNGNKIALIILIIALMVIGSIILFFILKYTNHASHVGADGLPRLSYFIRETDGTPTIYLEARYYGLKKMEVIFTTDDWKTQKIMELKNREPGVCQQVWRANLGRIDLNKAIEFYLIGYKSRDNIYHWNNNSLNYQLRFKKNDQKVEVFDTLPKEEEVIVINFNPNLMSSSVGSTVLMSLNDKIDLKSKQTLIHFSDNGWKTIKKQALTYSKENKFWMVDLGRVEPEKTMEYYITIVDSNGNKHRDDNNTQNYQFKTGVYKEVYHDQIIKQQKKELENMPMRSDMKAIQDYKKDHFVLVSLTTSPNRIAKIRNVIDTLDLDLVDEVVIVVPERYGRTQAEYAIPSELLGYRGKTTILRTGEDLGPIAKLLPTIDYIRSKWGEDGIVITVDDDTGYPRGMIAEFIVGLISKEKSVMSGGAQNLSFWNIKGFGFPGSSQINLCNQDGKNQYRLKDIVEGYGGIAYNSKEVDVDLMRFLSQKERFKECFFSDDLVISFVLAYTGINRYEINNQYYNIGLIRQFPYGFADDALHRGGGLLAKPIRNVNIEKYQKCYQMLIEATMDFDVLKLKDRKNLLKSSVM